LLERCCAVHASGEQVYKHFLFLLTDCSIPRNKLVAHNVLLQVYSNHLYHITTDSTRPSCICITLSSFYCVAGNRLHGSSFSDTWFNSLDWNIICLPYIWNIYIVSVVSFSVCLQKLAYCLWWSMFEAWNLACTLLSYWNCNTH